MFKRKGALVKEPSRELQGAVEKAETSKGLFQKASDFISKHAERGERLLEKERLIHEYDLDEYMSQFQDRFEYERDYEAARSAVLSDLIDEYLQNNPDRNKFTFKADYLESRIEDLFSLQIDYFSRKNSTKDIFEIDNR